MLNAKIHDNMEIRNSNSIPIINEKQILNEIKLLEEKIEGLGARIEVVFKRLSKLQRASNLSQPEQSQIELCLASMAETIRRIRRNVEYITESVEQFENLCEL